MFNRDWYVDGSYIAAPDAFRAKLEFENLYGDEPYTIRPWTAEDQSGLEGN